MKLEKLSEDEEQFLSRLLEDVIESKGKISIKCYDIFYCGVDCMRKRGKDVRRYEEYIYLKLPRGMNY